MTATPASFRAAFPEFSSTATYPDAQVNFWLALSGKLLNAERWDDLLDFGQQLFVAHNLTLWFNAKRAAALGQNPGAVLGTVTSGTVDGVSYTRDAASVMDPANGHWNLSSYGLRYRDLVRMIGAGPVHVGNEGGQVIVGGWPGVIPY